MKITKRQGLKRLFKTAVVVLGDKIELKLPNINATILVIKGGLDPFVSDEWARRVRDLLPKGQLVEIPGKGHTLNSNAPSELSSVITRYLQKSL